MQNRRIIERMLRDTGIDPNITLESDSMVLLYSHVRTGRWASVMPARLAVSLGLTESATLRAIRIVEPEASNAVGLIAQAREPMTPLVSALVAEARRVAPTLSD